mmetsp:Transcript_16607/g.63125  ORF Transcript_16607/g.63125 Transcript_16607/m.63125 type:complete len:206 (+) Transcript_16607:698-1315(+)
MLYSKRRRRPAICLCGLLNLVLPPARRCCGAQSGTWDADLPQEPVSPGSVEYGGLRSDEVAHAWDGRRDAGRHGSAHLKDASRDFHEGRCSLSVILAAQIDLDVVSHGKQSREKVGDLRHIRWVQRNVRGEDDVWLQCNHLLGQVRFVPVQHARRYAIWLGGEAPVRVYILGHPLHAATVLGEQHLLCAEALHHQSKESGARANL